MDYKRGHSSKVESLKDSHATGGGTRFQGTIVLLEWDRAKCLMFEKEM